MPISVMNKKTYRGVGEYIGRPSVLGNPFTHIPNGTIAKYVVASREVAVESYRGWLRDKWRENGPERAELERLVRKYKVNGELVLICWCHPEACHGDVLKDVIETLAGK